jgi:nucleoside-diphosphate-sugar epimerase
MNSEKLLIIGCGDLGQRLAHRVQQNFRSIIGVRRRIPAIVGDSAVQYIAMDATSAANYEKLGSLAPSVVVITMTPSAFTDAGYQQAYVSSCQQVCDYLGRQAVLPRLVVFVSSTRVYAQNQGEMVDENSETAPQGFAGQRLLEAEQVVRSSGLPHCIVRFSGIYGPGRSRLLNQVRDGKITRDNSITNRIHADDCAAVLAHVIDHHTADSPNVYLASDSLPAPLSDVVEWLAAEMKVSLPAAPETAPNLSGKTCSNKLLLESGFVFQYPEYQQGYRQVLASGE